MKQISIIILLFSFCSIINSQETVNERVYVHTDKNSYLAGEDIWVKFYAVNANFQPTELSKVGYIEICDTEKPHIQYKLALEKGRGAGKINIPLTLPSGVYQLYAYTRYMRNEDELAAFTKQVAVVNMIQESENNRIELVEPGKKINSVNRDNPNVRVATDKTSYTSRSLVNLSIDNLPADVSDLAISVVRKDSGEFVPVIDKEAWRRNVATASSKSVSQEWLPEYEGHIITGNIVSSTDESARKEQFDYFSSSIGFVGKDIRMIMGKVHNNGAVSYFTDEVYGKQEVVTSLLLGRVPVKGQRVDIVSPFVETLPQSLPTLQLYPEDQQLIERSVGVQLQHVMEVDSLGNQTPFNDLWSHIPVSSYDLDEYTRFNSVRQTIVEFILRVVVRKVDGENRLKVYFENEKRFNNGNTLVLLDGVPLYDHDLILNYNPYLIKYVDIYDGKYSFGGDFFDCIVAFKTYRYNLPSIQLGEESQLFVYDCPELPASFDKMPDYSIITNRISAIPDFRHTLYWEPFGEYMVKDATPLTFYTSDLTGEFKVIIEGITKTGQMIYGTSTFRVE